MADDTLNTYMVNDLFGNLRTNWEVFDSKVCEPTRKLECWWDVTMQALKIKRQVWADTEENALEKARFCWEDMVIISAKPARTPKHATYTAEEASSKQT